jgi:hypothetical protein
LGIIYGIIGPAAYAGGTSEAATRHSREESEMERTEYVKRTREDLAAARWTEERAAEYMKPFGTIVATNYVPSYCYNYIQLWYDFREDIIRRELGWAGNCGINSLRMFLPLFSFQPGGQWEDVKAKFRWFMDIAESMGMSVMVTFQPSYMRVERPETPREPYVRFRPGSHENHWQYPDSDFSNFKVHPGALQDMFAMMDDIMTEYKDDKRVIAWDLWNEAPGGERFTLEYIFWHARSINPSQPLTACWEAYDISDIITFHNYTRPLVPVDHYQYPGKTEQQYPLNGSVDFITEIERALSFNRPVLCTECLARTRPHENTFELFLPYFAKYHIGFYFWGLCAGSAQYQFPWGWPEGAPEPRDWFHCVLYPNGEPYREAEIEMLRNFAFGSDLP